ncbi:MAG: hypothetical protein ACKVHP_02955 [Verrucomicrobiales bacterium]
MPSNEKLDDELLKMTDHHTEALFTNPIKYDTLTSMTDEGSPEEEVCW